MNSRRRAHRMAVVRGAGRPRGRRWTRAAILALAATLDVLGVGPGEAPWWRDGAATPSRGNVFAAMAVQERHNPDLLGLPGVAGTAVAFGADGRPVVKVFLAAPGVAAIPASFDGYPVITEVTGPFRSLEAESTDPRQSFPRPVPIGVSAGQVDVTAGTIGARVRSGGDVFALSNNHVFANKNAANRGDPIVQPGRIDGGAAPADAIGNLHDFEPIRFCRPFPACPENRIDAAIAATTTAQLGNSTPPEGYGVPRTKTVAPALGMAVQKYGRTTGRTTARITGLNATVNVGFRDGTARFSGQIVISRSGFSGPGDSGSLIVTAGSTGGGRRPVGLLFAGSETSTLANPIGTVLDRFGVTIDGN